MTAAPPPSWINKGQPKAEWPAWLVAQVVGRPEANGSFMIRSKHGQQRVHRGYVVFDYRGDLFTCPAGEARAVLAGLLAADELVPPRPSNGPKEKADRVADVADRRDDTDDISARIRANTQAARPSAPVPPKPPMEVGRWLYTREAAIPEWVMMWIDDIDRDIGPDLELYFSNDEIANIGDTIVVVEPSGLSVERPVQKPAPPPLPAPVAKAPAIVLTGRIADPVGTMPSIEWIQLGRLLVDDSYQRSVDTGPSRALIARIGRSWDWRLCVPLMVSRRPAGLFVIDGQHRLFGARLRTDVPQLPCCISVYDSPADEAAMFVAANRERRAMNRLDDFHAAQAGGNEDALAVAALITSVGFTVSRKTGSGAWAPGEVAFTSAIGKARRRFGDVIARDALQLLAEAFPGQRLTVGSSLFTATASILGAPPPDFHRDRLLAALRTFDMPGWGSFINASKGGTDRAKHMREMLLEAYVDAGKAA